MADPDDAVLRLDPGNKNVLCETEPGTVEMRYRGLRRISARDLIRLANAAWYIVFDTENKVTLTLTNGAAAPKQEPITIDDKNNFNRRGTLTVKVGRAVNLTGTFASDWLSDSQHLDIIIEQETFSFLELKQPLNSLRKHRPDLFLRSILDRKPRRDQIALKEGTKFGSNGRRR